MTTSPEVLWPIRGCNILVNWDTNQPYAMPIRALAPTIEQAVTDRGDPRAWCKHALDNKSLSYEEKIACIQRAVILDPNSPGFWWTLGCLFELEGKDWYGVANAFNHVIFLKPRHAGAWFSLSQLWAARGMMGKAREAYARFQELQNKDYPRTRSAAEGASMERTEQAAQQILEQARQWLVDLLTVRSDREPTEEEEEKANRQVKLMEVWMDRLQDPTLRAAIQARLGTVVPMVRDMMIAVLKQAQEKAEDSNK